MTPTHTFGKQLRADAAWIVYTVLEDGRSTRDQLPRALTRYENSKDKNWLNEVVLGVLRTLPTLQTWLRPALSKPLKGDKKIIEHVIMVGLYQLHYMRVSDHAAINETVNACRSFNAESLKGLVNAILRNSQRQPPVQPEDARIASGLPKWLFKSIHKHYPNNANTVIDGMNATAPIWLRVNTQRVSFNDYCKQLDDANIAYEQPSRPDNALIVRGVAVPSLPGYEDGLFAVQDGAAQLAAWLLEAQNQESILDCCAAPGGKTCHISHLAPDANITAMDSDKKRLTRVEENIHRLHATAKILHANAMTPDTWWDGKQFDRILLDAPCSATGVIRRHPDIRWLRKAADIDALVDTQKAILDAVWPLLKPGGTLLYATCSIMPNENVQQVDAFVQRTTDATRNMDDIQILPGDEQMDGFYYARLIKSKSE